MTGAELYDPLRGSWSSAGRLHVAREGHTAALLPDGQVLGSGSDYAATGGGASAVSGDGGSWVEVDVTELAQAWVDTPTQPHGLLLRQASAAGSVIYDFCSERGVSPCTAAQTPQLIIWYR